MIVYNLRIIFANRFIWFLAAAVVFYLGLSVIYVFDQDVSNMKDLYGIFLFCGILLVFYPAAFGVQNDQDARTIEILFGIPNYRYKVWLVRIVLIFVIVFLNPYSPSWDINEATWAIIAFKNRIILIVSSIVFLLAALYNLQKREKFM
jgi:hypothetical protein